MIRSCQGICEELATRNLTETFWPAITTKRLYIQTGLPDLFFFKGGQTFSRKRPKTANKIAEKSQTLN